MFCRLFCIVGNVSRIAVRFWNYGKLNCLAFVASFKKQITKLFEKPKWRQCAVGSSFSAGFVPDRHKEKINCLELKKELSKQNIQFEECENGLIINASNGGVNREELLKDLSTMGVRVIQ